MLTKKAMLEILGQVEEEECGDGSLTAFTVQNCRDNQRKTYHFKSLTALYFWKLALPENIFLIAVVRTEEYNNLNNIIQQFHQIQLVLYHGSSENPQLEAILGLIDVNKILDDRLQVLFKAGYHCPDEIYFINNLIM